MKNFDTVQLLVLIVALIAGYHALIEIPQLLWLLIRWFDEGLRLTGYFSPVVTSTIYLAINIAAVFILISRSRQITEYILERSDYTGELKITQTRSELLSVTFVGIGVYILVTRIPDLLMSLYTYFKEKDLRAEPGTGYFTNYIMPGKSLPEIIMQIVLGIIIIVYSKQFTDFFGKQLKHDEIDEIGSSIK